MDVSSMGDEEFIVQINTEDASTKVVAGNWVDKVNTELNQLSERRSMETKRWKGEYIYRIPWSLKKLCSNAYHPQTVSVGPYHHDAISLKGMEKHKHRALLNFLERKNKPLQCYVDALAQVVDSLMGAYDQLQPKWKQDTEGFLQLMIFDGCFILEVMETKDANMGKLKKMGYATNDPVFSRHGHLYLGPLLRRDMLMLENQIPMLVLNIIMVVADGGGHLQSKKRELYERVLKFFRPKHKTMDSNDRGLAGCLRGLQKSMGIFNKEIASPPPTQAMRCISQDSEKCLHILDLYRKDQLQDLASHDRPRRPSCSKWCAFTEVVEPYIRSATELAEAGIRFDKSTTMRLNDISFHGGTLKLPAIDVDDALGSAYLNMMALERLHWEKWSEVTFYVLLMDNLIDSAKDVSLLHWRRIIRNSLGNDEAVAQLFNSLSKEACLDRENELYELHKEVTRYYRSPLRRCMAYAKHNYFTNTWVTLSIIAAIFLFSLTTTQTVYAILDFYRPDKGNS